MNVIMWSFRVRLSYKMRITDYGSEIILTRIIKNIFNKNERCIDLLFLFLLFFILNDVNIFFVDCRNTIYHYEIIQSYMH